LFAMFGDTSYSDRYRLSIASSFARKSKMPYVAALRHMLIAPETSKTELDTIVLILADLHDIESIPHMRAIFLDESASSWLRREALDALDSLGAPDVLQLSLHVYPSLDPDTGDREVLHAIVRAFSKYGDTRVVPLLKKLTKDPGPFNDLASMAKEAMDAIRTRAKATPRLDASAE
jgi:HEAT repeat protein